MGFAVLNAGCEWYIWLGGHFLVGVGLKQENKVKCIVGY